METAPQAGVSASFTNPGALVLDERLPLRAALGAAFAGILGYACSRADLAERDPIGSVHEFRKAVRRGRALLRLSRSMLARGEYRALNAELRTAVGASSAVRDVHVLGEALHRLRARKDAAVRAAAREVVEAMASERPRGGAERDVLRRSAWALRTLPERFFEALPRGVGWSDLANGLSKSYRRARAALKRAERTGDHADVHEFRKRVKELRYQLELFEAVGGWPKRGEQRALASLAQKLGAATDLIALRGLVTSRPELDTAQGRRLARAVDAQISAIVVRELPRARGLFRERPRRFAARTLERPA